MTIREQRISAEAADLAACESCGAASGEPCRAYRTEQGIFCWYLGVAWAILRAIIGLEDTPQFKPYPYIGAIIEPHNSRRPL
jgi:hypothetical protein